MGRVLLVHDRELDREVALKLIRGELGRVPCERFLREAKSLARLRHPNVVQVYESGWTQEGPYLTMQRVEGTTLERFPKQADPLEAIYDIARGLDAIHAAGLVHRDLKLPNLIRTPEGRVVLIDFGLALDPQRTRVTQAGIFVGTLLVACPEALLLEKPTPAWDWFALGVNGFLLTEKRFPFELDELLGVARGRPLPDLKFERLDPDQGMARILRGLLEPDPSARPQSLEALQGLASSPRPRSKPAQLETSPRPGAEPRDEEPSRTRSRTLGGILGLIAFLGLGFLGVSLSPQPPAPRQAQDPPRASGEASLLAQLKEALPDQAPNPCPPQEIPRTLGSPRALDQLTRLGNEELRALGASLQEHSRALRKLGLLDWTVLLEPDPSPKEGSQAAQASLTRARAIFHRAEESFGTPAASPPPELSLPLWEARSSAPDLVAWLREGLRRPSLGKELELWLRPGVLEVLRALGKISRAAQEDPDLAETLTLDLASVGPKIHPYFLLSPGFLPPSWLLGGEPKTPAEWFLRAEVLTLQGQAQSLAQGVPSLRLEAARDGAWEKAQAEPERSERSKARADLAWSRALQIELERLRDPGQKRARLEALREKLEALSSPARDIWRLSSP